jgi:predicted RNA-binding Zn-ribbon protein involved in translation (DUF1610 family)
MFGNDERPPAAALAGGLVALLALAGCAGRMEKPAPVPDRPASSVSVPTAQPAATLRPDALDAPAATSVADAQRSEEIAAEMKGAAGGHGGHEGHGGHAAGTGGTYVHVDAGREMTAQEEAAVYACPMHPEVTSTAPGKCPKCGMELVQRRKE